MWKRVSLLLGLLSLAPALLAVEPLPPDAELLEFLAELPETGDEALLEIALDEVEAESRANVTGPMVTVEESRHD